MTMKIRLKAFAVHFLISAVVVGIALALTYGLWYRPPFSYIENVTAVILVLAVVDLVMGPLMTFIVYNPGKKTLKMDLAIIGLVQLGALLYGMSVIYEARPVYAVYAGGRFSTASASEFEEAELAKAPADSPYLKFPKTGTEWIGASLEQLSDNDRQTAIMADAIGGGPRIMPRLFVPFATVAAEAVREGKRANAIDYENPVTVANQGKRKLVAPTRDELQTLLAQVKKFGLPLDQVVLVPLRGSEKRVIVGLDARTGKILGTIAQDPFWF